MSAPVLIGKYELLRKLAIGGMAEVYLARVAGPAGFEKRVVLKRILPHLAEDPAFVDMFMSEAKLAAQLSHPNVVQVFDFGEVQGTWLLTMEYVDGANLRVVTERSYELAQPLDFKVAARIIAQACEGLAYAHEFVDPSTGKHLELVHRDISPDNILLTRAGGVKVVDFGVAKAANQLHRTRPGIIKGKFSYMPPEQLTAEHVDRRADVFALGVVLYELLTGGHRPFEANSPAETADAILDDPPRPIAVHRPDVPTALRTILDRALEKEREQRYPDCRAMQADLERFISEQGGLVGSRPVADLVQQLVPAPFVPGPTRPAPAPTEVAGPDDPTRSHEGPVPGGTTVSNDLTPILSQPPAKARPQPPGPGMFTGLLVQAVSDRRIRRTFAAAFVLGAVALATVVLLEPKPRPLPPPPPPADERRTETPQPAPPPPPPVEAARQDQPPDAGAPAAVAALTRPERPRRPTPGRVDKPAAPAPAQTGQVEFRVKPYATVYVNGASYGVTPFKPVALPVGQVTVRLVNTDLGFEVTMPWQVQPGASVFKYNIRAP